MAAMKPRTGDGPLEVAEDGVRTEAGREVVLRLPALGGGRLVIEMSAFTISNRKLVTASCPVLPLPRIFPTVSGFLDGILPQ